MKERNNFDSLVESLIRDHIREVLHLSLATCSENKPWITELHFANDEDLNIYFLSRPNRRHSNEIEVNPSVAGNIIREHKLGDENRGIYFEGTAEKLENIDQDHRAFICYQQKFGINSSLLEEQKQHNGHRFYKIQIEKFSLIDQSRSELPEKYELIWNKLN